MLQILVLNEKDTFAHATKGLEPLQMWECFELLHKYETCCISRDAHGLVDIQAHRLYLSKNTVYI